MCAQGRHVLRASGSLVTVQTKLSRPSPVTSSPAGSGRPRGPQVPHQERGAPPARSARERAGRGRSARGRSARRVRTASPAHAPSAARLPLRGVESPAPDPPRRGCCRAARPDPWLPAKLVKKIRVVRKRARKEGARRSEAPPGSWRAGRRRRLRRDQEEPSRRAAGPI